MSLEQAKKNQPEAAQAQNNQGAPAPVKLITKPISDPHYIQSPEAELRKLTLPVPADQGEKDLFLVVLDKDQVIDGKKDEDDNNYQMYLGRSKSFKRGEGPAYYNTLVPLAPRCYATADRDPAQAIEIPEGWLYIVRQFTNPLTGSSEPELWRELKSDGLGNFSDVNLKRFNGKDQRRATGQSGLRIIVPYCINKQAHDLWIAYSEVQWSWARVQSMLDDSDLRDRRMHKLDLSDCLNNFANSGYTAPAEHQTGKQQNKQAGKKGSLTTAPGNLKSATDTYSQDPAEDQKEKPPVFDLGEVVVEGSGNSALLYNLKSAPDPESKNLPDIFKEALPVVYLDNPIGIGRRLAGEYQQQWQELSDCVKKLRAIPDYLKPKHEQPKHIRDSDFIDPEIRRMMAGPERYFEAAALANRYFYGKILKATPPGVKNPDAYQKRLTEIDKQFLEYQGKLDQAAIEQVLWVPQRRAIRKKLVQAREKLVDFLEKELAAIEPEKSGKKGDAQDPPLVLALDDYFTLTPLSDRERKQNPDDAVGDKSTPRWRDNYLDGWGAVYDLVEFLGKHEYSIDADLEAKPDDGWDWRRHNPAFKLLLDLADPEGGCPLHNRLFPKAAADDPLKIDAAKVEDTAPSFKRQHFDNLEFLKGRDADIAKGINLFGVNFSEVMAMRDKKDPAYEKQLQRAYHSLLRLVQTAANLILEEDEFSLTELIAEARREPQNSGAPIFKIFEKSADFLKKSIKDATDFPKTVEAQDGPLGRIRVRVVTVVNKNQIVSRLRDLGDQKAVTSGLAGLIGLIKVYNFSKALKAFTSNQNEDRDWEVFAPLASTLLKLPEAIKGVWDMAGAAAAMEPAGGATKVAWRVLRQKSMARAAEKSTVNEMLGKFGKKATLVAYLFDFDVTLRSLVENMAQNDDAAIADVIGLSGITVGILSGFIYIPGAGWFFGLTALAALLAKAFLFKEDTPVEIWINNGPFARGEEYHEAFYYNRSTTIKKVRDNKGNWVDTACTVHRYDNFEFLVDNAGILVHAGPSQFHSPIQRCRVAPDGTVYLKAGKWYDLPSNKWHEIPADTHVATVGQKFYMHHLLEPTQKTTAQALTAKQSTTGVDNPYKMRKLPPSLLLNSARSYETDMIFWPRPHDAYLALADAIYRPRVTLKKSSGRQVQCVFNVKVPFYIPGTSKLYIEFTDKAGNTTVEFIPAIPDNIKDLKVGPGEYEIVRTIKAGTVRNFEGKVRMQLFGDDEVQLPFEPLFCGSDIKTEIDKNTVKGTQFKSDTKWIIAKIEIANTIVY
jgi:hypothetical protein